MGLRLIESPERDPAANFDLEERLSQTLPPGNRLLRFWVNDPCLAVGRFQSVRHEVDTVRAAERGVPIFRRFTGGGTVYLDPGCLCVSFARRRDEPLRSRNVFDEGRYLTETVRDAIASWQGIQPPAVSFTLDDRNGLFADGRKLAGTAVCLTRDVFFWHLSLLVAADLAALRELILPSDPVTGPDDGPRVRSRRSPVANLTDFYPAATVPTCRVAIRDAFLRRMP